MFEDHSNFKMCFSIINKYKLYHLLKSKLIIKNNKIVNYKKNFKEIVIYIISLKGYSTNTFFKPEELVYTATFINVLFEMLLNCNYFSRKNIADITIIYKAINNSYFDYTLDKSSGFKKIIRKLKEVFYE